MRHVSPVRNGEDTSRRQLARSRPGRLRRSWAHFRRTPIMSRALWEQLKDYDRPDFHPDDRDTDALMEEWRDRLFGAEGTLNDKLVGSAA